MFCDRCGAQVQVTDTVCRACGKSLPLVASAAPGGAAGRVGKHIQTLAVLWMVVSAFILMGGGVLLIVANTLFARFRVSEAPGFLQPLLTFIGVLVVAKGAVGFLTGWGLMERRPWARILALILGFLMLLQVPFGTALGIYTIWVLLSPGADQEYSSLAVA